MKKRLVFVATTPFAVNAFLRPHLLALGETCDVTLCVNVHAYPLAADLAQRVRVVHIDFERKTSFLKDLAALYQLVKVFLDIAPDAVHSIMPKTGFLAMLAATAVRVPNRFHTFTGQVWATKRGLARSSLKFIDRTIACCATSVFADSPSQCRVLEAEKVVARVSVLGPGSIAGVDLERFAPNREIRDAERARVGTGAEGLVYLFVGRLTKDKGVFDLLQAFSLICQTQKTAELWMIGPDDEHLSGKLADLGRKLSAPVHLFGATEQPERYMAAADILVLPSYREGFGSVIIEAAASGIPVVAYLIDGVVDAVVDGETGLLVNVGDVEGLCDAMRRLGADKEAREEMGIRARRRVAERFSSTALTQHWVNFYKEL